MERKREGKRKGKDNIPTLWIITDRTARPVRLVMKSEGF